MSLDRYSRSNSVISEKEFRMVRLSSITRPADVGTRRSRARHRWHDVQRQVQSASAAFSAAGQERRKAFVERSWYTITGSEAIEAVKARSRSVDANSELQQREEQNELLPKTAQRYNSRSQDKSVSFSFDDDACSGSSYTPTPRRYTYRYVIHMQRTT